MYGNTVTKEIKPPLFILPSSSEHDNRIQLENAISSQLNFITYNEVKPSVSSQSSFDDNDSLLIDLSSPDDEQPSTSCTFSSRSSFNDSQNSYSPKNYSSQNSNQSDNSKKSYGLTDLMDNLFITPLDVQENPLYKIDYDRFFDKYEAKENNDQISVASEGNRSNNETTLFGGDKPKLALNNNDTHKLQYKAHNIESINDETIPKAAMFDALFDNLVDQSKATSLKLDKFDDEDEDLIEDIMHSKTIEKLLITNNKLKETIEKVKRTTFVNMNNASLADITCTSSKVSMNKSNVISIPVVDNNPKLTNKIVIFNPLRYYNPDRFFVTTKNLAHSGQELEVFRILTIKKDSKVYAKKRIITSDEDKFRYTRGPSLEEKRIILPQIMRRLAMKKHLMEMDKGFKKRYILDAGTCTAKGKVNVNDFNLVELNPEVLMEDCNKERLKALKTRQMFDSFVSTGNII